MLFRQLNIHEYHTGNVAEYYFVARKFHHSLSGWYLMTKEDNGWHEDQVNHYTNFKLEIVV